MVCNHCCKRKKKNTVRRGTAVKREEGYRGDKNIAKSTQNWSTTCYYGSDLSIGR